MALPSHLAGQAIVAWLKSLTPLKPEETRQRENHSQYVSSAATALDGELSDSLGKELWTILETQPAGAE